MAARAGASKFTDGQSTLDSRIDQQGAGIVSELHGRSYEQAVRGNYFGLNGALTTTSAAGTGTFTGTLIGNPVGSGVNLAIGKVLVSQAAALTGGTTIGVMYGASTLPITASLTTIFNRNPLGPASKCVATAGATVTAMTAFIVFGGGGNGAITVPLLIPAVGYDFEGALIIPPGFQIASYTSVATTTALVFTFSWEEVPIL